MNPKPNTEWLDEILRSEFIVNEHDDCSDDCSKKFYSNEAFERGKAQILKHISELDSMQYEKTKIHNDTNLFWLGRNSIRDDIKKELGIL